MGRPPCCDESGVKKGPWTREEDQKLVAFIHKHGHGSWRALPKRAGLNRCCKSCRLRWTNYLRPDIKRGNFSPEEEQAILTLHSILGNKWSTIATRLPGRTDNEIKNYWNTCLKKRLIGMGIDPVTHRPRARTDIASALPQLVALASLTVDLVGPSPWNNYHALHVAQSEAAVAAAQLQCLQSLLLQPPTPTATGASPLDMNILSFLSQAVASYATDATITPMVRSTTSQTYHEVKQRQEPVDDHGSRLELAVSPFAGTPVAVDHVDGCSGASEAGSLQDEHPFTNAYMRW